MIRHWRCILRVRMNKGGGKEIIMQKLNDIDELYNKLESEDPEGGYASRSTIFRKACQNGKITEDVCMQAREYYGSLWNYVGD